MVAVEEKSARDPGGERHGRRRRSASTCPSSYDSRYADDYHYFFAINALADVELKRTGSFLLQLLRHGLWIDRILYPAGLAALLLSLVWLRRLWRNPLFAASWIAFAGQRHLYPSPPG